MKDIEDAKKGFKMTEAPYIEGWLCPALFKYFPVAPDTLYVKAEGA